jgi:hypothetical protein
MKDSYLNIALCVCGLMIGLVTLLLIETMRPVATTDWTEQKIKEYAKHEFDRFYQIGYDQGFKDAKAEVEIVLDMNDEGVLLGVGEAVGKAVTGTGEVVGSVYATSIAMSNTVSFENYLRISYEDGHVVVWTDPNVPMNEVAESFFAEVRKLVEP